MAWLLVYLLSFLYHRLIILISSGLSHRISQRAETDGHGGSVRGRVRSKAKIEM